MPLLAQNPNDFLTRITKCALSMITGVEEGDDVSKAIVERYKAQTEFTKADLSLDEFNQRTHRLEDGTEFRFDTRWADSVWDEYRQATLTSSG